MREGGGGGGGAGDVPPVPTPPPDPPLIHVVVLYGFKNGMSIAWMDWG